MVAQLIKEQQQGINPKAGNEALSKREEEVQSLVKKGLTSNQIADKLFISFNTVKTHRKNIAKKQW